MNRADLDLLDKQLRERTYQTIGKLALLAYNPNDAQKRDVIEKVIQEFLLSIGHDDIVTAWNAAMNRTRSLG